MQKFFVPLRAVIGADVQHMVNVMAFVQKLRRNIRMGVFGRQLLAVVRAGIFCVVI